MRKSANVEKRRCHVARAALVTNLNGARDRYGSASTAAAASRAESSQSFPTLTRRDIGAPPDFDAGSKPLSGLQLGLLQGKWKIGILCRLQEGPARLGDLRRLFPQASKKMLTQHLRQMERDGLIVRTDLSGKIPHVEYSLSNSLGPSVVKLINMLAQWGAQYSSDRFRGGESQARSGRNAELS